MPLQGNRGAIGRDVSGTAALLITAAGAGGRPCYRLCQNPSAGFSRRVIAVLPRAGFSISSPTSPGSGAPQARLRGSPRARGKKARLSLSLSAGLPARPQQAGSSGGGLSQTAAKDAARPRSAFSLSAATRLASPWPLLFAPICLGRAFQGGLRSLSLRRRRATRPPASISISAPTWSVGAANRPATVNCSNQFRGCRAVHAGLYLEAGGPDASAARVVSSSPQQGGGLISVQLILQSTSWEPPATRRG